MNLARVAGARGRVVATGQALPPSWISFPLAGSPTSPSGCSGSETAVPWARDCASKTGRKMRHRAWKGAAKCNTNPSPSGTASYERQGGAECRCPLVAHRPPPPVHTAAAIRLGELGLAALCHWSICTWVTDRKTAAEILHQGWHGGKNAWSEGATAAEECDQGLHLSGPSSPPTRRSPGRGTPGSPGR